MIPTLEEWKRNNPGRGVNEYFKKYPKTEVQPIAPIQAAPAAPIIITTKKKKKRNLYYGNILFSILVGIGFFLPLIKDGAYKTWKLPSITCFDIPKIYDFPSLQISILPHELIFLIPIGVAISLLGELLQGWMLKLGGQFIALLAFCFMTYLFYIGMENANPDFVEFKDTLHYGYYMTAAGIGFYIFDMFFGEK